MMNNLSVSFLSVGFKYLETVLIFLLAVDHDIRLVKNKQDFGLTQITYHVEEKFDQGFFRFSYA